MAIPATNTGGTTFEPLPADSYIARCYQMVHIGTVPEEFKGEKKMINKVMVTFEIPSEMRKYGEEEQEKPASISKEYTLSLSDKANLRRDLEAWRAKPFTEEEAKYFDLEKLIGAPCMLGIVVKETSNGNKNRVGSVTKLHKDLKCPPQINPSKVLSYDKFDLQVFESLPDFLKDKIKSSLEYKSMIGEKVADDKSINQNIPPVLGEDDEFDDLPF